VNPLEAGLLRSTVFVVGCILGSFLGAAAYRIPRGMSLVHQRSHCPACGHVLGPGDLVPVLSYVLRRGRCGYCGEGISRRYPIVEALSGLLTLTLFLRHGLGGAFVVYTVLILWALLLSVIDLEYRRLPNVLTLSGMAAGLAINVGWYLAGGGAVITVPGGKWQGVWQGSLVSPGFWGAWEAFAPHFSPLHSLLGVLVGGGVLWVMAVVSRGGMGGGDMKFLAAIGSFMGPGAALLVLFIGSVLGSAVGLTCIATGRLSRREPIPFGPFLAAGTLILALLG
jgi:leader peptidase (prepilin peptidase)/N-methyltransferase